MNFTRRRRELIGGLTVRNESIMFPGAMHSKSAEIKTHKDLEVWKKAISFVTDIYKMTAEFQSNEIYGLTNQIRRAAVSIPSNISEGFSRTTDKELLQFLQIARSSATELDTQLIIAKNIGYISNEISGVDSQLLEIRKMLSALITKFRSRIK